MRKQKERRDSSRYQLGSKTLEVLPMAVLTTPSYMALHVEVEYKEGNFSYSQTLRQDVRRFLLLRVLRMVTTVWRILMAAFHTRSRLYLSSGVVEVRVERDFLVPLTRKDRITR